MKFRPTEFLNTPYRVSCYIRLYRKLFSGMRPVGGKEGGGTGWGCSREDFRVRIWNMLMIIASDS